jgi:hypothetical protein
MVAGIEHRARRHAGRANQPHCFVLVAPLRPVGDHLVDLRFVPATRLGRRKARIVEQLLPANDSQQASPVLGIGVAGKQIDIIVGATGLAWIDTRRRQATSQKFGAVAHCRLTSACVRHKSAACVLQLGILHCDFDPTTATGCVAPIKRPQNADRQ